MRDTVVGNMWKRQAVAGTLYLETTTMFEPGANSAAEKTFGEAEALLEGRKRRGNHRLYLDHRWGEVRDLTDEAGLRAAIRDAYGDALAWMDLNALVDKVYDTRTPEARVRRYMLNTKTSTKDAWLKEHEWVGCKDPTKHLADRDLVTLGFDGSIGGPDADATALVACRVSDGHLELLDCWEKPEDVDGEDWVVDRLAVDAAVSQAMRRFDVAGFYADPPHWTDFLAEWHQRWAEKMRVQASRAQPMHWWTNKSVVVHALAAFHEAVLEKRLSYTPAEDRAGRQAELAMTLTRHVLNARREPKRSGLHIRKEYPKSPRKIDAAMAAVLAWQCRQDAVAAGVKPASTDFFLPTRLR